MDVTKILTASIVVLLAAGGAVAGTGVGSLAVTDATNSVSNANVYATTDNNTVEMTLVDEADGVGVANATVEVERHYEQASDDDDGAHESVHVGTTDENGTVAFQLTPDGETRNITAIAVEFTKGAFTGEVTYRVENDSLSVIEEEYEYEHEQESENGTDDEHETENRDDDNTETGESDDDRMSVGMSDAREIADAALESPSDGRWVLVEADAHEEDHYYEFEYVLADGDHPGEAELRIHGSTGEVIDYEQEIEFEEEPEDETEDDEYESEDETDDDDDDADEDDDDDERGDD